MRHGYTTDGKNGGWPDYSWLPAPSGEAAVELEKVPSPALADSSGGGGQRWVDDGVRDLKGGEVIER